MGPPLVSVVIPVFNKVQFVADTVRSVMAQTYGAVELIVVDDGSTDGSQAIVRQTIGDYPARYVQIRNSGVSQARNSGAAVASHDSGYILFLDADDILREDAISTLVEHLERHPAAAACYCCLSYIDAGGSSLPSPESDHRWERAWFGRRRVAADSMITPLESIWSWFDAIPSCCLVRRDRFAATDGWDSSLCPPAVVFGAEDKDMAIQLALKGEIHRLSEQLLSYRVMPSARKDSIYEGLQALNLKWWFAPLESRDRSRVRGAIRFEYRANLLDALGNLAQALGRPTGAVLASACKEVVRDATRWALAGSRMHRLARRRRLADP